jgi:hypothetical protein
MTRQRLPWLLALLVVLAVLRVFVPPRSEVAMPVSEAVMRSSTSAPGAVAEASDAPARPDEPQVAMNDPDPPGNAFVVRPPPLPPYVPPAPPPPKVGKALPVVAPPVAVIAMTEPPPPPVPFQVIGTWDDGSNPGVFLSSSSGTLLARAGVTLQSEYKVTAVTGQQVSLTHLSSKRTIQLAIPQVPNTPLQPWIR